MLHPIRIRTTFSLALAWLLFESFNPATTGEGTRAAAPTSPAPAAYRIKKIVLDAGHGGKDPGCRGANSWEKDNALAVVLGLGAKIEQDFPEIQVLYTRKTDVFIELNERAAMANREKADLFISVHCNAVGSHKIQGTETYVLGVDRAEHNLAVAKRENAAIFYEENYQQNYGGYDPNSPESHILSAMWQSAYLDQSILFASLVQKFAVSHAEQNDKGVKQAGFLVIRETAMPAVLVETGYLTNAHDEQKLASDEGREKMSTAIFEAFKAYKRQLEGTTNQPEVGPKRKVHTESPGLKSVKWTAPKAAPLPAKNRAVEQGANLLKHSKSTTSPPEPTEAKGTFSILLTSSPTRLDLTAERFQLVGQVEEKREGNQFRYYTGTFASEKAAGTMLAEVKNLGFRQAEIIRINRV